MKNNNPTVVFTGPNTVTVRHESTPRPKPGEVLIQTHCSLISVGTELTVLSDDPRVGQVWSHSRKYPLYPGYCNVGTAIEATDEAGERLLGQRVACRARHGAFAACPVTACWPVPDNVRDEEAAFIGLGHVALMGLRRSKLELGECATIYGLGVIGQILVQLCHLAGARPVIAIDIAESRLGRVACKPGVYIVNPEDRDPAEAVSEFTDGRMAEVVFEATGLAELIPREFAALKQQGRFVVVSSPRGATTFDFADLCNWTSASILGAHVYAHPIEESPFAPWTAARHASLFFDLIARGDLNMRDLISHRIPVEDAPQMYTTLQNDRSQALGVILTGFQ